MISVKLSENVYRIRLENSSDYIIFYANCLVENCYCKAENTTHTIGCIRKKNKTLGVFNEKHREELERIFADWKSNQ